MTLPALRFKDESGRDFPEWKVESLGNIADLTSSKRVYLSDYVNEGVPFYRGKEISELKRNEIPKDILYITRSAYEIFKNNYGVPKINDILITAVGTLGNVYRVKNDSEFYFKDGNLIWLRNIKIASEFLEVLIDNNNDKLQKSSIGSTQRALTIVELKKLRFNIPSKAEQTKIANFLTAVDEKISLLTQKHDLLSQYKKGVMQQIFSQELRFKDNDGQDFPEWEINSLEDISINYYQGINTAADKIEYVGDGVPIIQAKHITGEYLDFSDARGLHQSDYDKYKEKYNPKINDLLISNIGTLGKVVLVESKINFLIAWNIFKVTLDTKKCYPRYIREYLKKIASDGYFDSIKTGNATKFINKSDMLAIEIIFPSMKEQTKIANFLTAIDDKITATQTQLKAVKQYKQGLLQQMFV